MKTGGSIDRIYTWLKHGCYQRTLHYHNTPKLNEKLYEKQLDYMNEHYKTVCPEEVKNYLGGAARGERPSIVIGVFDGYRNNYDVLWRLLEERGMKAWYLLVTDFLDAPAARQEGVLLPYRMQWMPGEYADGRYAMDWEEAARISENHVIVNHSATHYPLTDKTPEDTIQYEVVHAHERIVEKLGKKPDVFSWLWGAWLGVNPAADSVLKSLGYHFQIGYRMEYFEKDEKESAEPVWEPAVPDESEPAVLEEEIRRQDQVIGNIGWYSAVPAILPLYQKGRLVTEGNVPEDIEMAGHFAAVAYHLMKVQYLDEDSAAQRALEVLAVNRIGEGFLFH